MKDLQKEIEKFLAEVDDGNNGKFPADIMDLTVTIVAYAHKDQKRLNGDMYITHPFRMCENYLKLIKMAYHEIKQETLDFFNIPNKGVDILCNLHDVIEDSEITMDDLIEVYKYYGYGDYFIANIKEPLYLLTHNKTESYEIYINRMLHNPEACLVKFLDMNDNLNMFELDSFGNKEEERAIKYIHCLKVINDKWKFVEKFDNYHKCLKDD